LYDVNNNKTVGFVDWIDPIKGKLPGPASAELKFLADHDPAVYSDVKITGTTAEQIEKQVENAPVTDVNQAWGKEHVGELWLDTTDLIYQWYEQGTNEYRKDNWGALFPGANVLVYEWVESDYTPERWSELSNTEDGSSEGISGTPRSTRYYVTKTFFDNNKQATVTKYYFWVNDTVLTPNLPTRTLSARQVQNIISDPIGQGYTFTAFVNSNAIAYANVDPLLDDNNIVHHVEWATTDTPLPKHDEWIILKEGDEKSKPNTILKTKLIDSLIGRDAKSNNVPDNTLSVTQQYGLEDGQSMIKNRTAVLTAVIENINAVLSQYKVVSLRDIAKIR
jgi:hypothetical protein